MRYLKYSMINAEKRIIGIDLLKVVAAWLVVALHTLSANKGALTFIVLTFATTAIPIFFLINGYFVLSKREITVRYAAIKIGRILLTCFAWETLHAIVYLLYYHEIRNFICSFFLDFFQKGLFFHFWFMGVLIILYCVAPFLHQLYCKHETIYRDLMIGLGILCIVLDMLMMITKTEFVLNVPQNLRLWYWLFYYMMGGWFARKKDTNQIYLHLITGKVKLVTIIGTIATSIAWQYLVGYVISDHCRIETLYGCFPVMLAVVVFFLCFTEIKSFSPRQEKMITYLLSLSMGVYIFHPFILAVMKKFVPAFVDGSVMMNLLFWISTVFVSTIVALVVNAIPLVRRLIRL